MRVGKKLVRDALLIIVGIGSFLLLFALQALLSEHFLTGKVVEIGNPEDQPGVTVGQKEPTQPVKPVTKVLDAKSQCWIHQGMRAEDLAIVGSLLQQTSCSTDVPKQKVQAQVVDNCVNVLIGNEATTRLCMQDKQPAFSLELPSPQTAQVLIPDTSRHYWIVLLILLAAIGILFVWGKTDLQHDLYRRRADQDYTRLLPGDAEVQIRYIRPPPLYVKEGLLMETKAPMLPQHLPTVFVKPAPNQEKALSTGLNKSLINFNTLSQELSNLIAQKNFSVAEKKYPELNKLALELHPKVTDENKPRLLKVVTTLHEQLQDVRKATSVAQDVRDVYQREQPKEKPLEIAVWKPAAQFTLEKDETRHLDRSLTKLRQLLEQSKHTEASQHHKKYF